MNLAKQHTAHKQISAVYAIDFPSQSIFVAHVSLSLSLPPVLSTMKLNTAFALFLTMMAIESRRDVVASSLSSASDEDISAQTKKVRPVIIVSIFYILSFH